MLRTLNSSLLPAFKILLDILLPPGFLELAAFLPPPGLPPGARAALAGNCDYSRWEKKSLKIRLKGAPPGHHGPLELHRDGLQRAISVTEILVVYRKSSWSAA